MAVGNYSVRRESGERGATLVIFTLSLFLLMGMGALAIDLASMYVARSESQQAADAAALAGAKYFVESGCVTIGNCSSFETIATGRATEVASQSLIEGQGATLNGAPVFNESQAQNPQITVAVQSSQLRLYFLPALANLASLVGATGPSTVPITVGATATAEAYNPSGITAGPTYCTGCVRPWLIANCDQVIATHSHPNTNCPMSVDYLLDPTTNYGVANNDCVTAGGVIGELIDVHLQTQPTLYGAMDVDTPALGNLADYQQGITTCFTGQTTCGPRNVTTFNIGVAAAATTTGVQNLMHIAGLGIIGQDTIDTSVCPPQITAGAANPYGANGLIATSDSIVTAYIFDPVTPLTPGVAQTVNIVGFIQIFVTQADVLNPGEFSGVILGMTGCGSGPGGTCGAGAGSGTSINSSSLIPVRLISPGN